MLPLAIIGVLFGVGEAQKVGKPAVRPVGQAARALAPNDAVLARFLAQNPQCANASGVNAANCRTAYCGSFNPADPWCRVRIAQEGGMPPPPGGGGAGFAPPPSGGMPPPGGTPGMPPGGSFGQPPGGSFGQPPGGDFGHPPGEGSFGQPPGGFPGQPPGGGSFGPPPGGSFGQPPGGGSFGPPPGGGGSEFGQFGHSREERQQQTEIPSDLAGKCADSQSCRSYCTDASASEPSCQQARQYLQHKSAMEQRQQRGQGQQGFGQGDQGQGPGEQGENGMNEQQNAQCLSQVTRGAQQIGKMFSGIERKLASMEKRGINVSAVREILDQLKALVEQMKNVQDCSEMADIGPQIGELMQSLQEKLQGIERLSGLPKAITQFERDLTRIEKRMKNALVKLARQKIEVDTGAAATLGDQVKACVTQAKAELADGNADAADTLETCREGIEELQQKVNVIEGLTTLSRQQGRIKSEIAKMKRDVKAAERRKLDASAATAAIAEVENGLAQLQAAVKAGDLDGVADILGGMEDALDNARDILDELLGRNQIEYKKEFGDVNAPKGLEDFIVKPPSFLL